MERDGEGLDHVALVERWIGAFNGGWPSVEDLRGMLAPDVRFVERPNLVNATGGERDLDGMVAGIQAGRSLLVWQRFEPLDHVVQGELVVSRMRWEGEIAMDAGPWPRGTRLRAWCVGHYRIRDGLIAHVEQHDCYEQPELPATPPPSFAFV